MASARRSSSPSSPPRKKPRGSAGVPTSAPLPLGFQCATIVAAVENATHDAVDSREALHEILQHAEEILLTDDGASWVYVVPQWYKRIYARQTTSSLPYDKWFHAVWDLHPNECGTIKLFGKEIRTPRYQQAYGVTHRFSGATFPAEPFPSILQHAVATIQRMLVDPETNATLLTAGLFNWYADGDHYMGPHSDEGVNIHANSPIFSLTLGPAVRRFVFTPRGASASAATSKKVELQLGDGDLLVMGGTTQKTHKHALPKMKKCRDRRVNVTLRYFK